MPAFRSRRPRAGPPPDATPSAGDPYQAGLLLLARREWSVARLRARLLEDGHDPGAVEPAIERLVAAGALDDRRLALTHARTASRVKSRGRYRILRELAALGVAEDVARRALDEALPADEGAAQLDRALDRRLRGPMDERAVRRLYASLVRLGHPPGEVAAALRRRRHEVPETEPED
jgi:SOS response regulatory protein OraA/RecX